jgi:hypothetical protein
MATVSPDILHRVLSAFNDVKTPHVGRITISSAEIRIACDLAGFNATIECASGACDVSACDASRSDGAGDVTVLLSKLYGAASNARAIGSGPLTLSVDAGGCLVVESVKVVEFVKVRARIHAAPFRESDAASLREASLRESASHAFGTVGAEVNMKWLATAIKKTAAADSGIVRMGVKSNELFIGGDNSTFVKPVFGLAPAEITMPMDTLKIIVRSAFCGVTGVIAITNNHVSLHIDNAPIHVHIKATSDINAA